MVGPTFWSSWQVMRQQQQLLLQQLHHRSGYDDGDRPVYLRDPVYLKVHLTTTQDSNDERIMESWEFPVRRVIQERPEDRAMYHLFCGHGTCFHHDPMTKDHHHLHSSQSCPLPLSWDYPYSWLGQAHASYPKEVVLPNDESVVVSCCLGH